MKHRVWGFTVLRGPGSSLSSRQRSCEYFLLSDPYLCLKVLLYKPQHASSWIKTSSPAASVTACLQNFMLLKKRGNLEQNEPLCPVPNHSELLQTQKGKEENLLRLVKQNNATSFFFISSHIFLSLFSHPMGSTECWERWEGGCKRRKEWGRDDKKARAHKSKQTNRIKPGLKAVRRQRTEWQDYDRSSAAQRTAGWWSNTGAAGPPQHVHGGPGGQSERKKKQKKSKRQLLCPSVWWELWSFKLWDENGKSQSLASEGLIVWAPSKGDVTQRGSLHDHPLGRSVTGAPAGRYACVYEHVRGVKITERWEREGLASRKRERMHRCLLHLCTTAGPKNLPWQPTSTPCIQWLKDPLLPIAGPVSGLTTLIFSRPFCCLI